MDRTLVDRLSAVWIRPLAKPIGASGALINIAAGVAITLLGAVFGEWIVAIGGLALVCLALIIPQTLLRLVSTLLGLLLLFQNEAVSGAVKISFVAIAVVFATISLVRIMGARPRLGELYKRAVRPALLACALFAGVPALSLIQVAISGVSLDAWFRDGVTYFLIPMAILIGIDAGLSLRPALIITTTVAASALGGVLSLTTWLGRRGGDELGFEQFGLASSLTVFAGIALCLALFFNGAHLSLAWLTAGLTLVGLLMSTGGRQSALFAVVGVVAAALLGKGGLLMRISRALIAAAGAGLLLVAIFAFSEQFGGGIAARRLNFFSRVADQGWSVVNADGSVFDRTNAYAWTLEIWLAQPVIGRGLGIPFPSVRSGQTVDGDFTLDTPLIVLAKFGLLGAIALSAALVLAFVAAARATAFAEYAPLAPKTFVLTAAALVVVTLLNGFPTENRGLPVLLLSLVAVAFSTVSAAPRERPGESAGAAFAFRDTDVRRPAASERQ